jgi:hypothetical protein
VVGAFSFGLGLRKQIGKGASGSGYLGWVQMVGPSLRGFAWTGVGFWVSSIYKGCGWFFPALWLLLIAPVCITLVC